MYKILSDDSKKSLYDETGEIDDGLDNNGNGLVDEGRVVLTENLGGADERDRILARRVRELLEGELDNGVDDNGNGLVDEKGFSFERMGESLVIRMTMERIDVGQRTIERSAQTSVRLRN